ncbi:hypothetical protein C6503_15760 [Candidatus Poribacteria bacterium]|nr:MAG: hypothetical protein C6503_15760 [Candidatus Poribacteria bacterium]
MREKFKLIVEQYILGCPIYLKKHEFMDLAQVLSEKINMANIISRKLSGCYRRVLTFLLVIIAVSAIAVIVVYRQVGGPEGAHYWMAEQALNRIEKHLKSEGQRPDGIPEEQIIQSFQRVREAIQKRQVNRTALYEVLTSYQTEFNEKKPSTPEIQAFLQTLAGTILGNTDSKN